MPAFHVIGLMSGTSLDGLDLAYCRFEETATGWAYAVLVAETIAYQPDWRTRLAETYHGSALQLAETHAHYGRWLGQQTAIFRQKHAITQVDFVASHGHTVFHQPAKGFTLQIGDGAALSATANLPVICDFRTLDVALGGQGAPLVPIGDHLLFPHYDVCLNLGGIANVSGLQDGQRVAFDVAPANLVINELAGHKNLDYDDNGQLARSGQLQPQLLAQLNALAFYAQPPPRSLGREWVEAQVLPLLTFAGVTVENQLHTFCHHLAIQLQRSLTSFSAKAAKQSVLVTGGGALNGFLIETLRQYTQTNAEVTVPDERTVLFKEALIFAFLGVLRRLGRPNCLASVTGARHDSSSGAIYGEINS